MAGDGGCGAAEEEEDVSATKVGIRIECAVCGQTKQPRGRSAPLEGYYCDRDCPGYDQSPHVGALWPGETDADFGYPCSDTGTEPVDAGLLRRLNGANK